MRTIRRWESILGILALCSWLVSAQPSPTHAMHPSEANNGGSWSNEFAPAYTVNQAFTVYDPISWNETLYARTRGAAYGVVFWDGFQWAYLGALQGSVDAIAVYRDQLYAVGDFNPNDSFRYLAVWNGNFWTILSDRIESEYVLTLESYADELYIASRGLRVNGANYGSIARWNGSRWAGLGNPFGAIPLDLEASPDGLYLAGMLSGVVPNNQGAIVRWNGTQWQSLANGLHGIVNDIHWADNQLYVSGQFTSTVSPAIHNIAAWDGSAWNSLGVGINREVASLTVVDHQLYALSEELSSTYALQHWNGISWSILNQTTQTLDNFSHRQVALVNYQNNLHAIGSIQVIDPALISAQPWANNGLRWSAEGWQAMQPLGFTGNLPSIAAAGETIYAYNAQGLRTGQPNAAALLKLEPQAQWQTLHPYTTTLTVTDSQLLDPMVVLSDTSYLANSSGLYQSTGTAWALIANVPVTSLAIDQHQLYVAGDFDNFNGLAADNLLMWDGSEWHGMDIPATFSQIQAMDVYQGVVYITDGHQLARWDGSQWQLLLSNVVAITEVEAAPDGVYIAGSFSDVAGVFAINLARWRNGDWSGLGGYIDGPVYDIELGPDGLYVAGSFYGISQSAGGPTLVASPGILRWNNEWFSVGGGVQKRHGPPNTVIKVYQLVSTNDRMYVSGVFDTVGNSYCSSLIGAWQYGNSALLHANGDTASTYRPHAVAINVLANDWGYPLQNIELLAVANGSHGTAIISGNQIVYTPDVDFTGSDIVEYSIRDSVRAITSSASIDISVLNHVPTLTPLTIYVQPNTTTMIDVLAGLVDLNGDPLTITQASASFGTVTIVNNQLRYTIGNQQRFNVTITYTVSDNHAAPVTNKVFVISAAKLVYLPAVIR